MLKFLFAAVYIPTYKKRIILPWFSISFKNQWTPQQKYITNLRYQRRCLAYFAYVISLQALYDVVYSNVV